MICPAARFVLNRTDKTNGRNATEIASIKGRNPIKKTGVDIGMKWARNLFPLDRMEIAQVPPTRLIEINTVTL